MMWLSVCFLILYIGHITHSVTVIYDEWLDDFLHDVDGFNGWNNNIVNNGTLHRYHGWFGGDSPSEISLYRHFKCSKPSIISISFTLHYACDIEPRHGLKLYFNQKKNAEFYLRFNDTVNKVFDINNELQPNPCRNHKAQNMNYLVAGDIMDKLEVFFINFTFQFSPQMSYGFESMSNIKIECQEAYISTNYISTTQFIAETLRLNDNNMQYLLDWWSSKKNWAWKAFIIVAVLCAMIGCIVIACILGYFRGQKGPKNRARYSKKNQFGFGPESIEFSQKQCKQFAETNSTEIVIDDEATFTINKNDLNGMISPAKHAPNAAKSTPHISNKTMKKTENKKKMRSHPPHTRYNYNQHVVQIQRSQPIYHEKKPHQITRTMPSIDIKRSAFKTPYRITRSIVPPKLSRNPTSTTAASTTSILTSRSSVSSVSTSTLTSSSPTSCSSSSRDSVSIITSKQSYNDSQTSFPTRTASSETTDNNEEDDEEQALKMKYNNYDKYIYHNSDEITTATARTSDASQTKTQSDYREYLPLNAFAAKNTMKRYKYNYNDDEELVEMDENYPNNHNSQW